MVFAVIELKFDGVMMNIGEASDFDVEMEDDLSDMDAMSPSFFHFEVHPFLLVLLLQVWKHMPEVVDDLSIYCYNVVAHFGL